MFCPNCGKEATGKFCSNCGASLPETMPVDPEKDFIVEKNGKSINMTELIHQKQANQKRTSNPEMDNIKAMIEVSKQLKKGYGLRDPEAKEIMNLPEVTKLLNIHHSDSNVVKCPHCGSTQISAVKKGIGVGKAAAGGLAAGPSACWLVESVQIKLKEFA